MTLAETCDIGAYLAVKNGMASTIATAGGSGDNAEVTGTTIDRLALGQYFRSAIVLIACNDGAGGVGAAETVKVTFNIEHSDDNFSSTDDYIQPGATSTVIANAETIYTGTATSGIKAYKVNLSEAKRYVRLMVTPNLSASGTDQAYTQAFWIFGGADQVPTTLNA